MYSIKLDIDDNILDKVMLFLNNIPKKNIEVKQMDGNNSHHEKLADFFMKSQLREEITLVRSSEKNQNPKS